MLAQFERIFAHKTVRTIGRWFTLITFAFGCIIFPFLLLASIVFVGVNIAEHDWLWVFLWTIYVFFYGWMTLFGWREMPKLWRGRKGSNDN